MRKAKFFAAALLAMSSLGAFAQHQFTVQANKPGAEIQPTMYGIFFEDINFGADGGLYAEMVAQAHVRSRLVLRTVASSAWA